MVVVGSANVDVALRVRSIPRPGETVLADGLERSPGGKGANQAVAAARAGVTTALVAALGADDGGAMVRAALERSGVLTGLLRSSARPTGTAVITVDDAGENAITVAPGANHDLVLDEPALRAVRAASVLLLQLEIPLSTVRAAAAAGRYVVLNAAPAAVLDDALLGLVDLLVVNEHEAAVVGGTPARLLDLVPAAVVTLGGDGALLLRRGTEAIRLAGLDAAVVDTTGAGDTFCGVLAAGLAAGSDLAAAVRRANIAGALAVESPGGIPSVPDAARIDAVARAFIGQK